MSSAPVKLYFRGFPNELSDEELKLFFNSMTPVLSIFTVRSAEQPWGFVELNSMDNIDLIRRIGAGGLVLQGHLITLSLTEDFSQELESSSSASSLVSENSSEERELAQIMQQASDEAQGIHYPSDLASSSRSTTGFVPIDSSIFQMPPPPPPGRSLYRPPLYRGYASARSAYRLAHPVIRPARFVLPEPRPPYVAGPFQARPSNSRDGAPVNGFVRLEVGEGRPRPTTFRFVPRRHPFQQPSRPSTSGASGYMSSRSEPEVPGNLEGSSPLPSLHPPVPKRTREPQEEGEISSDTSSMSSSDNLTLLELSEMSLDTVAGASARTSLGIIAGTSSGISTETCLGISAGTSLGISAGTSLGITAGTSSEKASEEDIPIMVVVTLGGEDEPTETKEAEPTEIGEAEPTETKETDPTETTEAKSTETQEAEPMEVREDEPAESREVERTETRESELFESRKDKSTQTEPQHGGIKTAQGGLETAQGEIEPAQGAIEPAQGEIELAQEEIEPAQGEIELAQGEIELAQEEIEPAQEEIEPAQGEIEPAQGETDTAQGETKEEEEKKKE